MKMKTLLLCTISALSLLAVPASAGQFLSSHGKYEVGALSGAGGFSTASGGIVKQKTYSNTGAVAEGDLTVKLDENGVKKLDGEFHVGGFAVQQNEVKANGWGSAAVSAAGSTGGFKAKVEKNGGGF